VSWFEPEFFGISPYEAEAMDPQQRLLLEVSQEALSDSGIASKSLKGRRTGVFIGAAASDYSQRFVNEERTELAPFLATGNSGSFLSNRVSYMFDWMGPASPSTRPAPRRWWPSTWRARACAAAPATSRWPVASTSCRRRSRSYGSPGCRPWRPMGAARRSTPPATLRPRRGLRRAGLEASVRRAGGGRSHPRPHPGTAVGQDGHSSGITAPNPDAQEQLLRNALSAAKVAPEEIQYVEAHGTGTVLGDPIEVEALGRVFGKRSGYLSIGSVKSNIGHLETAAGMAGVSKTLLSLQHREIPPSVHFKTPNPHIPWETLPSECKKSSDHGPSRRSACWRA